MPVHSPTSRFLHAQLCFVRQLRQCNVAGVCTPLHFALFVHAHPPVQPPFSDAVVSNRLKIPTGRRQTSWLCTSVAEELNQGLPETNLAGG